MVPQVIAPGFHHVTCAACGADDAEPRWETQLGDVQQVDLEEFFRCTNTQYGRFGRIVRCRRCGLMYRDPQEDDLLAAYTDSTDDDYLAEWPARRETFRRSFRQLHRFIQPPGDLLDVGCATGFALRVAEASGWQAVGLEPSRWAVLQARQQGLTVVEGVLEHSPFAPERFDVVTLWDVIEHVPDPRETLRAVHGLLRPGGVLALTTMDMGSLAARLLGTRWPHLMRMHLWYFRYPHVVSLLEEAGFVAPRRFSHVRVLSAGYLASRLKLAGDGLSRAVARALEALRLGDVLVPIQLGDLMAVYARKP